MFNALLVKDGKLEEVTYEDHKDILRMVENVFTTAFRLPGYAGGHSTIDAYCDDEFLITGKPLHFAVGEKFYRGGYAFGGPVLITGGDAYTGESRQMLPEEIGAFSLSGPRPVPVQDMVMLLPVLDYRLPPGY
jgi:hypothetical protein